MTTGVGDVTYDRLVWTPDAIGSACVLVSGYLAYIEACGGLLWTKHRALEWKIAAVNLVGCIAFGISAIAAFVLPSTGSIVDLAWANALTGSAGSASW